MIDALRQESGGEASVQARARRIPCENRPHQGCPAVFIFRIYVNACAVSDKRLHDVRVPVAVGIQKGFIHAHRFSSI